ncbi:hypothetical protein DCAR_0727323 [Daucus carota subsp. sativus]|uniref:Angiotensin-converting enzyme 2 n=1 Tax=Daucus carota subsp. sativus TaxID=79200 RepID=A0AAF0XIZ2_DAUCS|nr:hypothetical protein DCAR_0727323 [Daucus carota subsp. sativus]
MGTGNTSVQNLIEQCLIRYMTRKEVMNFLSVKKKIEPAVTELVWQKLEQENQEFFNAYNLRLTLKEQIAEFNQLLERQVKMMHHADTAGVSYRPVSASHVSPSKSSFLISNILIITNYVYSCSHSKSNS